MWKRKLVWKNDSIEFTFQDPVLTLEESFQDDKMRFKATMKNGNKIKEVELKMTLKTVPDEKDDDMKLKPEKQEYFEHGSLLNPIKLEEDNNNELTDSQMEMVDSNFGENAIQKVTGKTQNDVTDEIGVKKARDVKEKRKRSALDGCKDVVKTNDIVETDPSKKKPALDESCLLPSVDTGAENKKDVIIITSETESSSDDSSDEDETQGDKSAGPGPSTLEDPHIPTTSSHEPEIHVFRCPYLFRDGQCPQLEMDRDSLRDHWLSHPDALNVDNFVPSGLSIEKVGHFQCPVDGCSFRHLIWGSVREHWRLSHPEVASSGSRFNAHYIHITTKTISGELLSRVEQPNEKRRFSGRLAEKPSKIDYSEN